MARKIAFFDLDGTFFRWQLYHEVVFEFKARGLFDSKTANQLDQALIDWQARRLNWHDYEMQVVRSFEPVISRVKPADFEDVAQTIISRSGHKIYNYTHRLRQSLADEGYYTLAISGSQQEIAEAFASTYGFDATIGALYSRQSNKFTGEVARRVPGRKHEIINEFMAENSDLTMTDSVAVGDSSGDISMLELVDNPIAFNPDASLLQIAQDNGWPIVIERKNTAYTLKKDRNGQYVLADSEQF